MNLGGKLGAVNQVGIEFYSKIIDNLLLRGTMISDSLEFLLNVLELFDLKK